MTSDGLAACCQCSKTAKCKSVKCPCFERNKPCVSCASTRPDKCENKQHFHFSGSVEKLDEPGKAVDGSPESGFDADSFVDFHTCCFDGRDFLRALNLLVRNFLLMKTLRKLSIKSFRSSV